MSLDKGDVEKTENVSSIDTQIDLATYHEVNAGRLVIDPECVTQCLKLDLDVDCVGHREARIEFGDAIASKLKLSRDGTKVLWPQPSDSPHDPQNWTERKKNLQLLIITLAAIVPDFDSGIGIDLHTLEFSAKTRRNCVNFQAGTTIRRFSRCYKQ